MGLVLCSVFVVLLLTSRTVCYQVDDKQCSETVDGSSCHSATLNCVEDEDENSNDAHDDDHDNSADSLTIHHFQPHAQVKTKPGELAPLKWSDNEDTIDPFASIVGLPNELVPTIQAYAGRIRITQGLKKVLYNNPGEAPDGRLFKTSNPHKYEFPSVRHRDRLFWFARTPPKEWSSDIHWIFPKDEYTHETTLQMLVQGGILQVVDAIGAHYQLDNLFIRSAGFIAISHCDDKLLHTDFRNVDGKYFHLLVPVATPENAGPELVVAGYRQLSNETVLVGTKVKYTSEHGVLIGDGTLHSSHECDHRPESDIRISMSIKIAQITRGNVDEIASHTTTFFPVPQVTDYLWAQQGRHWRKDQCIVQDYGREAFMPQDQLDSCKQDAEDGWCENDPQRTRELCPESCDVYMHATEYRTGMERRAAMGEFDYDIT